MTIRFLRRAAAAALFAASLPSGAAAQAGNSAEARTARYFEAVRDQPPLLTALLREMPKGGDLHSHLSGAVYAESYLRWAAEDGACVDMRVPRIVNAPCTPAGDSIIPATQAVSNAGIHDRLVDAMSMRNWNAARLNGHDQFFGTFGRFAAADYRTGDMLAEAQSRAAAGGVSYLELMLTADGRMARTLGDRAGWVPDFGRMRDTLLALGMADVARLASARLDTVEARRDTVLRCGTLDPDHGCRVTVRWLYQVSRANPPEQVFAQILLGFVLASMDSTVVGFNLVQPEDNPVAMRDYSLQMRIIGFLRGYYPGVKVSLHAGELVPGLVPPEGLRYHISQAVWVAMADRIGHGVDVMHENRAHELLREMAGRRVMVEIALTSNAVILGVSGDEHPLRAYLAAGVPVALATDDEGVGRSEMTMEYLRAARDQGLDYLTLKRMARTSLDRAFLRGGSVWQDVRRDLPIDECAPAAGGMEGVRCRDFAETSSKARLQRDLERAFTAFEARWASMTP